MLVSSHEMKTVRTFSWRERRCHRTTKRQRLEAESPDSRKRNFFFNNSTAGTHSSSVSAPLPLGNILITYGQ